MTTTSSIKISPGRRKISPRVETAVETEDLVRRFPAPSRRKVRRLIHFSPRLVDLARTFPAAAFAMATWVGAPEKRRRAQGLIEAGAPLKDVARLLELPMWLRRLPPEAFDRPLAGVPASPLIARRIVNHLPETPAQSAMWLASVCFADNACDDYFALWIASQNIFKQRGDPAELLSVLAAYAWHSGAECSRVQQLIATPWRPEMGLDTAVCAAKSWLNRIRLVLQLPAGRMSDAWLDPAQVNGYSFVPLLCDTDLLSESQFMHNCADQYAGRLANDKCRLFSVRRRGIRVATLEIGHHPRQPGLLTIVQLKARHNMAAPVEVWRACYTWLAKNRALKRTMPVDPPSRPFDTALWLNLLQGYRAAKNGAPWLPDLQDPTAFSRLDRQMLQLAQRGGITSWLFT